MFKIKCLNPISKIGLDHFTENYCLTDDLNEADAVLVRSTPMHDLKFPNTLKAIARAGAGVNNIPLERCSEEGIVVFNTPGANANGVKELVMASLFLASRDIIGGVNWVKSIKDDPDLIKLVEKNKAKFAGIEVIRRNLAVIGLGAVGVQVANAAVKLGMEVYGYDPYISVRSAWNLSKHIKPCSSLEEILGVGDFLTIHVPLAKNTREMLNEKTFAMMKDGIRILNFSRDSLVNEDDLIKALKSGKVSKYITDFPTPKIVSLDNVIAIPHLGASTCESEENCAVMAVNQLMNFLENGAICNSVNYPDCDNGYCDAVGRVAVYHRNIPKMISQFTTAFAEAQINISDMINKSKGQYAYTLLDIDTPATTEMVHNIEQIEGVLRVRVIK
ncbi:MAG: phosphoglycerate dehydrogenase [Desulfitobacteriia bacterium]|jgi:D-3-phosphoglycerate dehydrogenase